MNPLEIYLIELIDGEKESEFEEEKVSSSSQRMRLLGTGFYQRHLLTINVTDKVLRLWVDVDRALNYIP